MATRTTRRVFDDIDGSEIRPGEGEQVQFSVRSVAYRIDLSEANVARFDADLKPFVEAAATIGGGRRERVGVDVGKPSPEQLAAIRAWARSAGFEVSGRGRIRAEVIEAFDASH